MALFVSDCFDGVEIRGFGRRVEAEDDSYYRTDGEGENHRRRVDLHRPVGEEFNHPCGDSAEKNAQNTSRHRYDDGLYQELHHDVAPRGAYAHTQAYLPCAFRDADDHNVHDADASDKQ